MAGHVSSSPSPYLLRLLINTSIAHLSLHFISLATCLLLQQPIMDAIRASPADFDPMVKIELEAAEALAGLAHFPATVSESHGSESIAERVKDESNSSFDTSHSYEKKSGNSGILNQKLVKDEQSIDLRLNPAYPTNCSSSGRKSRQNLTEAEMEARKIRRVLANRESARQTIRRRQAIFEELTRKAVDLAWENENLKKEKDTASKHYDSLKTKNESLKAQMIKVTNLETDETHEKSTTLNEQAISSSSTNSPFIIYNQPPFLPVIWPSMIHPTNSGQLPAGINSGQLPAGIVFPVNKPDSSEEGSSTTGSPLYLLPYPWLVTLPQNTTQPPPQPRLHSFNLNDKPKECSEFREFFPEKALETPNHHGFPPDGGGRQTPEPPRVSCEALIEHDSEEIDGEIHKVPMCSGKRLGGDVAAAAEARKRRKQLTRLKGHFHCRQLRMH
ncbi:uncharacterized protein LOC111894405 isoform X1 [Lactuca sativa]|uniref:uncharacterized protein LOC111894405 isoform X1 n=1 Tax=Lactuca sativa TaxID=4236 RepID=UPI0022B05A8F|nr:uncharacterized protein LOC111894405 isoform X1 [Lactuca sativa]